MNRLDKLKRLEVEVSRLFKEYRDEETIFNQLRANPNFADVKRREVTSFYTNLRKKAEHKYHLIQLELEYQRQVDMHERQLFQLITGGKQIAAELERLDKHYQNANQCMIYNKPEDNYAHIRTIWQSRYILTVENEDSDDEMHTLNIHDMLQDELRSFTVQKLGSICDVSTLEFPFVLIRENGFEVTCFKLARVDLENNNLEVVQMLQYSSICRVLVNSSDSSRFLLQQENQGIYKCKLANSYVEIGEKLGVNLNFHDNCIAYVDDQLFGLLYELNDQDGFIQLNEVKMLNFSVGLSNLLFLVLDSTPDNVDCYDPHNSCYYEWVRDHIFIAVRFPLVEKNGIIFAGSKTRTWTTIEFVSDLPIDFIQFASNENLMICAEERKDEEEERERKIYKVPVRKPDTLREMAWLKLIKKFKEGKVDDPYAKARKFLPLNSDIQPFVFI